METMKFDEASPADLSAEASAKAEGGASQGEGNNQAPRSGGARNKKLIWAGIILSALILAVIGWQYWQYTQSPYYQQMKAVKVIEAQQKESDKWGGKTPEETVRLFTEAVKKGDFELASKYGNAELIKPKLEQLKNDSKLSILIRGLETGKVKIFSDEKSANLMVQENGQEFWVLSMGKSEGGTWKIVEF